MNFTPQWLSDFGSLVRRRRLARVARQASQVAARRSSRAWTGVEALESRTLLSTAALSGINELVNAAPNSATVTFSEAVANVTISNITIRKSGILVATPGGAAITDSGNGITWNLTGISDAFETDGLYKITVLRTGIIDVDETDDTDEMTANASLSFELDTVAPDAPASLDLVTDSDSGASDTDNITNDPTPTITGTAEAGSLIELFDGVTSLGTTTADEDGAWSITLSTLSDDDYTLTAKATDAADNTSVASADLEVTIDTTAPNPPAALNLLTANDSGSSDTDDITSVTAVTINGTSEANALINVFDGDASIGTTTANGGGEWSFTTSELSDGVHTFVAKAADTAGNTSSSSASVIVTIDTAIATPVITGLTSGSDTGVSDTDAITSNTTPTLTGTAEANADVEIFEGLNSLGTVTADGEGVWSFTTNALAEDTYSFTVVATDAAGNVSSASAALVVVINTTAPAAPTGLNLATESDSGTSSTDNLTNDTTPTITGTAEAGALVELFDDATSVGTAIADDSGNWTITTTALSGGVRTLTATASNIAGNTSNASGDFVITIDATAPDAPVALDLITDDDNGASDTDNLTSVATPTITGIAAADALIELFDGETSIGTTTADGSGEWSITASTLAAGVHSLTATATDAAGNTSAASDALSITIDSIAPTATITAVTPDPRSSPVTSITIVFSEAVTGFTIADLALTRDAGDNLLTDDQTLSTTDNITWTLTGLSSLTSTAGAYVLTLAATGSGITDPTGNAFAVDASESFAVTANNNGPTFSSVKTIKSAIRQTPFTITYDDLLAAANEKDKDANTVFVFRIDSVTNGTLTKNNVAVDAGTTTLAAGESLVLTPPTGTSSKVKAFKVSVTDGVTFAAKSVQVSVKVDKPSVGIVANGNTAEAGPTANTFTVTRNGVTTEDLVVSYSISGKAKNGVDYVTLTGTVTIAAGQSTATITITPIADELTDPNETLTLKLKSKSTYSVDSLAKLDTLTIV